MKEKKKKGKQLSLTVFMVLLGILCGVWIGIAIDDMLIEEGIFPGILFVVIELWIAVYAQILIHEAGHLVFGLLGGYRFSSFRIGSFMWIREEGKLRLKRYSLAGTGGQCLMAPPNVPAGEMPVVLYNFGGCLLNLISAGIFFCLERVTDGYLWISMLFMMLAVIGLVFALSNGIPLRLGTLDNDGYNALSLRKDPQARYSFWLQLKLNEQLLYGVRLKDMPEEWFVLPEDESMGNSMTAAVGVFICNRLMDQHQFEKANALMKHYTEISDGMSGLHRKLLDCDRIYCELILNPLENSAAELYTDELKKFMKTMKSFPSILRTEYVYALLYEKDIKKAEKLRERFERITRKYPYPAELEGERELMDRAENSRS